MGIAISLDNVSVKYGAYLAVSNCSFEVEEGEIFGLLGSNGAGKSTVMKVISGQIKPTAGNFKLFNRQLLSAYEIRKIIGVVPQEYSFAFDFTVAENLELMISLYDFGGQKHDEIFDRQIQNYLLSKKTDVRVADLSGGYKRLLNFALSTIHSPKIILLDEPTVGLDPEIRSTIWETIRKMKQNGSTLILTTHYLEEAAFLCDRIAIIFKGAILAIGTPASLIEQYGGDTKIFLQLSANAEQMAEKAKKVKGVISAISDDRLLLLTCVNSDVAKIISTVYKMITDENIAVKDSYVKEGTLDDVFKAIVGREIGVKA
ncbi:ABC transporter ATP-binding protein [Candidatus Micrarchaeota archaeon]|nr:ABC transporter ATP-binding protein [Candidatus Micrarchaeota archaeon]